MHIPQNPGQLRQQRGKTVRICSYTEILIFAYTEVYIMIWKGYEDLVSKAYQANSDFFKTTTNLAIHILYNVYNTCRQIYTQTM